jgi:hypothetical protein
MNEDLKLRLIPFADLDTNGQMWWGHIAGKLSDSIRSWYPIKIHMVVIDPPDHPDDDTGYVEFDDSAELKAFDVYLDNRMPIGMVMDYLIHELAHVGTWFVHEPEDHGPMFGVEYARLYREYLTLYDQYWDVL